MRALLVWPCVAALAAAAGTSAWSSSAPEAPQTSFPPIQTAISDHRVQLSPTQLHDAIAEGALDREVKSLLKVDEPLHHGQFLWDDRNVPAAAAWIRVDLGSQLISVFRGRHEIGTAVVLYGAQDKQTPVGKFHVKWKARNHRSSSYDAPMPYTLRLTDDGVAIHGSDVRPTRATHGCIGVPVEFAKRVFDEISTGGDVVIISGPAKGERSVLPGQPGAAIG